jgi:hypothetical protein
MDAVLILGASSVGLMYYSILRSSFPELPISIVSRTGSNPILRSALDDGIRTIEIRAVAECSAFSELGSVPIPEIVMVDDLDINPSCIIAAFPCHALKDSLKLLRARGLTTLDV